MSQTFKKIIIMMSVLAYISTVQSMAMMMPAGSQGNNCHKSHSMAMSMTMNTAVSVQIEDSLHMEISIIQDQTKESSQGNHHCMACFATPAGETDYLSDSQIKLATNVQSVIKDLCSVALTILSPPPKRLLS